MSRLLTDWKFLSVTLIAALAFALVCVNLTVHSANRDRQAEVAQRQQFINESVQLSRVNTQFIQALAQLSAQTNDESIRRLLAEHGITFTVNAPTGADTDE
jgi:type VI protein secretion system component VasK